MWGKKYDYATVEVSEEDTYDETRAKFDISEKQNVVDWMENEMFNMMYVRLKERQIQFYAFLNI